MGLEPIYSTIDPDGNPATMGEDAARILRDNFTKVEIAIGTKADKTLVSVLKITSDAEYLYAIVDNEYRLLFGIRHDATYYFASDIIPQSLYDKLKEITDYLGDIKQRFSVEEFEDYIKLELDASNKILSYYTNDGTFCPQKLKMPENAMLQILTEVNDNVNIAAIDHSNKKSFAVPIPTSLMDIYVTAPVNDLTTKDQAVKGSIVFMGDGWTARKYVEIGWQGSTSVLFTYPELDPKNWSIDLFNDEACTESCEIRFGTWVYRDSFHFKKNYIDGFKSRNVINSKLTEKIYETRPFSRRYPFSTISDIGDASINNQMWSGAMCHIDGFLFRLFINGQNRGLHTLNLSKHRSNYQMKKNNKKQILFEFSGNTRLIHPIDYPTMEFRNPSGIDPGAVLPDGETKDIVENFFNKISDVAIRIVGNRYYAGGVDTGIDVVNRRSDVIRIINNYWSIGETYNLVHYIPTGYTEATLKAYLNEFMPSEFWVDFFVFQDFLKNPDSIVKNTLIAIYENGKAYPCNYDMDAVQGINSWMGTISSVAAGFAGINQRTDAICQPIFCLYYRLFRTEIGARYRELRDLKIFDIKNILDMHTDFMSVAGIDAFNEDFKLFPETPSFRENNVNEEYWSFAQNDNPIAPTWDSATAYNQGDKVKISNLKFVFTAKTANTNQNPLKFIYTGFPQVGGFYSGLGHLETFLQNQIEYLDTYYNYNNA